MSFRVCYLSTHTNTCRTQKDTSVGVFSWSASFLHPPTHTKHERDTIAVSVRGRRLSYTHPLTPNTKRHLQWCLFMLGIFLTPTDARQTQRDTFIGVCSCSVSFLHSYHAQRLSYLSDACRARKHTRHWCVFVFSTLTGKKG